MAIKNRNKEVCGESIVGNVAQTAQWSINWLPLGLILVIVIALIVWTLIWKGLALWKAARHGSAGWFVALLLINTAGILDILYIYVFSKKHKKVE